MKPGDFLLGVMDFFAILLPGSMATWLLTRYLPPPVLSDMLAFEVTGQATPNVWVLVSAFALSAYVLGHFVFKLGSWLDGPYDRWRRRAHPQHRDSNFQAADALRRTLFGDVSNEDVSTFKWAKAYIQVHAPEARGEIDRLEADQKFFRSLVVIAVAFAAHFLLRDASPVAGGISVAMGGLAFRIFVDKRWKAMELTYCTALVAHRGKASLA